MKKKGKVIGKALNDAKKGELLLTSDEWLNVKFNAEPDTIAFHAKKITVSNDELCLKFDEAIFDLDKIRTLVFEWEDLKYEFERKNKP